MTFRPSMKTRKQGVILFAAGNRGHYSFVSVIAICQAV